MPHNIDLFFATVIALNAIIIGFQADLTDEQATQFGWVFVDNGFTFLFVIEAILRFYYVRWRVVLEPWLLFDLILVLISVFDIWISVVAGTEGSKSNGLRMLSVFRMFRVLLTGSATDVLGSRGTANRGSWEWDRASTPSPAPCDHVHPGG